jgi:hypothetical protein
MCVCVCVCLPGCCDSVMLRFCDAARTSLSTLRCCADIPLTLFCCVGTKTAPVTGILLNPSNKHCPSLWWRMVIWGLTRKWKSVWPTQVSICFCSLLSLPLLLLPLLSSSTSALCSHFLCSHLASLSRALLLHRGQRSDGRHVHIYNISLTSLRHLYNISIFIHRGQRSDGCHGSAFQPYAAYALLDQGTRGQCRGDRGQTCGGRGGASFRNVITIIIISISRRSSSSITIGKWWW